jgi:hypothetical protein
MPDDIKIMYHSYYKGCSLSSYTTADVWTFPNNEETKKAVVINPADNYDGRASRKI